MAEAKESARQYLNIPNFSIGAYSDSKGIAITRKNIANWIYKRDQIKADPENIYLTNGGLNAYDHIVSTLFKPGDGLLVPNPCHPLILQHNSCNLIENVFYDLDSSNNWKLNVFKNIFIIN